MADPTGGVSSESLQARYASISGCAMLFCKGLTDLHAVTVNALGVYPVKLERSRESPEVISHVQRLIARPPLWLRRALGTAAPTGAPLAA
ncbi:MAG: hypothetical protein JZU52_18820 [Lamprocystis purpurea]|uniref:hypothetical protein n=1 Tax=Lamprocystis purpurea TaxID=61598 RepID=UPI00035C332B|nr:hypothetical protein [Lamprocystis purpurea]MBV5275596.1 hypothetical protein [Lamprocystis purpurea]